MAHCGKPRWENGAFGEIRTGIGNKNTHRNPAAAYLCLVQITHKLTRYWAWAAIVNYCISYGTAQWTAQSSTATNTFLKLYKEFEQSRQTSIPVWCCCSLWPSPGLVMPAPYCTCSPGLAATSQPLVPSYLGHAVVPSVWSSCVDVLFSCRQRYALPCQSHRLLVDLS